MVLNLITQFVIQEVTILRLLLKIMVKLNLQFQLVSINVENPVKLPDHLKDQILLLISQTFAQIALLAPSPEQGLVSRFETINGTP